MADNAAHSPTIDKSQSPASKDKKGNSQSPMDASKIDEYNKKTSKKEMHYTIEGQNLDDAINKIS